VSPERLRNTHSLIVPCRPRPGDLQILTGVAAAFLTYIVVGIEVHLRIHVGRWVPDAWKAHHLSHHVRPQKNFNIFLPIFDWLLGSKNMSFSRMS
jgi:sterol desaturase/sphingolipid hydroxylase (fatty acid hydroxylase superfamily)